MSVSAIELMAGAVSSALGPIRVTEVGKIKVGGKGAERQKRGGGGTWRMPESHDYFTVTTLARAPNGDLVQDSGVMEELLSKYADSDGRLRQLPIRLLSDDIDDVLQARFVWYGKSKPGAVSDGETVTWYYDPAEMKPYNPPKVEPWSPEMLKLTMRGTDNPLFKLHSNLSCVIHSEESRWGGVYKLRTTSVITFKQLYSTLLSISQLTGGVLVGMPLWLIVRPMVVSPKGQTTTVNVVHCELRGSDIKEIRNIAEAEAIHRNKFSTDIRRLQSQYRALLVAPGNEPPEEVEDIVSEFVPYAAGDAHESADDIENRIVDMKDQWKSWYKSSPHSPNENILDAYRDWVYSVTGEAFEHLVATSWNEQRISLCEQKLQDLRSVIEGEFSEVVSEPQV